MLFSSKVGLYKHQCLTKMKKVHTARVFCILTTTKKDESSFFKFNDVRYLNCTKYSVLLLIR